MKLRSVLTIVVLCFFGVGAPRAEVPLTVSHQGYVVVDGTPFNGSGLFRFAFIDPATGNSVWTNDGTQVGTAGPPDAAVTLPVANGVYSVALGDADIAHMTSISGTAFDTVPLALRVWFDDTVHGIQMLSPDQALSSAPFAVRALRADFVSDSGVSSEAIADGGVHAVDLQNGATLSEIIDDDGAGSGLDADLLDGLESTEFMPAAEDRWVDDGGDTIGGDLIFTTPNTGIVFHDGTRQVTASSGGVPSGYGVLGESSSAPPGFSYTGCTLTTTDTRQGGWETHMAMPEPRSGVAAAAVGRTVYIFGGNPTTDSVYAYDTTNYGWTKVTTTPSVRDLTEAAAIDTKIYLVAGWDGTGFTNRLEVYDTASDSWETKASLATPRAGMVVVAIDGYIYAVGGYNSSPGDLQSVERYDPASDSWTAMSPMPAGRSFFTGAALNGKIYVVGGSGMGYVDIYDPGTNSWTTRDIDPMGRFDGAGATINGKLHVVGGDDAHTLIYDDASGLWTSGAEIPTSRRHLATVAVNNRIYAFGGYDGAQDLATVEVYGAGTKTWYLHQRD